MTRQSSAPSAPAWLVPTIDERVLEVVERAKAVGHLSASELRIRAKTIPLREIPSAAHVPTDIRTSNVVAIASDHSPRAGSSQRRHDEQCLRESEREILDVIVSLGGFASSRAIADIVGCSPRALLRRELHDLAVKGVIEAVHGHGWRVRK